MLDYDRTNEELMKLLHHRDMVYPADQWKPNLEDPMRITPIEDVVQLPHPIEKMIRAQRARVFIKNDVPTTTMPIKFIYIPRPSQFPTTGEFMKVLFHELTHSTARDTKRGPLIRPMEEMIAEVGAMYLTEAFNFKYNARWSAGYVDDWAALLNPRHVEALRIAVREAKKSTQYLLQKAQ